MSFSEAQRETRRRALEEGMTPDQQVQARIQQERREDEERKAFNDYVSAVMTDMGRAFQEGASSYTFSLGPTWDKGRWENLQKRYPHGHTTIDLKKAAQVVSQHMEVQCISVGDDSYRVDF